MAAATNFEHALDQNQFKVPRCESHAYIGVSKYLVIMTHNLLLL